MKIPRHRKGKKRRGPKFILPKKIWSSIVAKLNGK